MIVTHSVKCLLEKLKNNMKKYLYIILGWLFVGLAILWAFLPVLPTVPFLILASGFFAKSSKKFHWMLLNNKFLWKQLRDREKTKTISRIIKIRAASITTISVWISMYFLRDNLYFIILLFILLNISLYFIFKIPESK